MSKLLRSSGTGKKVFGVILVLIILILIAGFIGISFAASNSDRIFKGVKISNLSVQLEDLTKDEAMTALSSFEEQLGKKKFVLNYNGTTAEFYGKDINLKVPVSVVDNAANAGREDGFFSSGVSFIKSILGMEIATIDADLTYDKDTLKTYVSSLIATSGAQAVSGDAQILDDVIKVKKGHDGMTPKYDELEKNLFATAGLLDNTSAINVDVEIQKAAEVDFDALYNKVYKKKSNATYENGKYVAEVVGVSFDKNRAYTEYRALLPDGEMEIKLIKDVPEVTTENLDSVLFGEELGKFKTYYNASNLNRSSNLNLAANSINGKIYAPGEEFSYNDVLGERTAARGYKEAHVYSGGEVVDGLGGGICQVSSTLYNAVLLADLQVTERKNHMFYPEYVEPSFDATVAFGSIDFKFKNNRSTPIKIVASAKGGVCTVSIMGKKEDDEPTISLYSKVISKKEPVSITRNDPTLEEGKSVVSQNPVVGYVSEGYKIYKDANGKEIKREKISSDTYTPTNKITKIGTKKVATPTTPVPTTAPVVTEEPPTTPTPATVTPPTPTPTPSTQWPTGWDTPLNPDYKG